MITLFDIVYFFFPFYTLNDKTEKKPRSFSLLSFEWKDINLSLPNKYNMNNKKRFIAGR